MGDLIEKILANGVFALVAVAEGFVILYLYKQLERVTDRLVTKSETDAKVNADLAAKTQAMMEGFLGRATTRRRKGDGDE